MKERDVSDAPGRRKWAQTPGLLVNHNSQFTGISEYEEQICFVCYQVDLRTITLGVPPQEVRLSDHMRMWTNQKSEECDDIILIISDFYDTMFIQKVLTKDSVTVSVDAVVYYRYHITFLLISLVFGFMKHI